MAPYSTGEVARALGVTVRTVQYYDQRGLVRPSGETEGGRRLYSETDLARLRIVCFLRELGFSLRDIHKLVAMDGEAVAPVLELLVDEREDELTRAMATTREQLLGLRELRRSLAALSQPTLSSIGAVASLMGSRTKLHRLYAHMLAFSICADVIEVATVWLWIAVGIWWPFAAALALIAPACAIVIRHYYTHVAYICPEDGTVFRPPFKEWALTHHTLRTHRLTCPHCGFRGDCLETYADPGEALPERHA